MARSLLGNLLLFDVNAETFPGDVPSHRRRRSAAHDNAFPFPSRTPPSTVRIVMARSPDWKGTAHEE
jgi:hypothetical protein